MLITLDVKKDGWKHTYVVRELIHQQWQDIYIMPTLEDAANVKSDIDRAVSRPHDIEERYIRTEKL